MVTAYFKNIRQKLLSELDGAEDKIIIAVYWFTNEELFNKLVEKRKKGLQVELIIHHDYINNRETGLPFQSFINEGGKFYFSNSVNPMHNKFCVIDNKVLINGSYNWTYFAEYKNRENILIIKEEEETIKAFVNEFEKLKSLTEEVKHIQQLTRFEIDEFNQLSASEYLANDIVFQAKSTGRHSIVETAFQIAQVSIDVQKTAYDLGLTKKWRLRHSIGSSLKNDKYLIIVPKGTMIPVSLSKIVVTTEDNQRSSSSTIHFGENPRASKNKQFAEMKISGIPPKPAGQAKLKYNCTIDINGNFRLEKFSLDTGRRQIIYKEIMGLLEELNE